MLKAVSGDDKHAYDGQQSRNASVHGPIRDIGDQSSDEGKTRPHVTWIVIHGYPQTSLHALEID